MNGCPKHPGGDRACPDVRCERTWKPEGVPRCPTREEQLQMWLEGRSVCPNDFHECCPDFSCCEPTLQWPEEKRRKFAKADDGTRQKMLMGALSAAISKLKPGGQVRVTRGVPEDDE